ncbi:MAG: FIST signal transduction protein [Vicinamibacterales bacterium]
MRTRQQQWSETKGWSDEEGDERAGLALVFGSRTALEGPALHDVPRRFPSALVVGCSTAGEICGDRVLDGSLVVTAVTFESSTARSVTLPIADPALSRDVGVALGDALASDDLRHTLVLSDGLAVNGSELVEGLGASLPPAVRVTGGLAADGTRFEQTLVLADGRPATRVVTAVGLDGPSLQIGYGSLGGWDPFGPERLVTRATGNVLHTLDGRPALDLYEEYLGDHAAGLPATGLLFPLSVWLRGRDQPVVRTILAVDRTARSITFAGDVPAGSRARFMRANIDRLVDGAVGAAAACSATGAALGGSLALLISCVGRRLVLGQRIEEEVEAVRGVLGVGTTMTGFYSYGEISPFTPRARCELHNQTMTVTTFAEGPGQPPCTAS